MKKSIAYLALFLAAGVAFSCKKDNSNANTPSLHGIQIAEKPVPYVAPGTTLTFKADVSAVYTSDDSKPQEPVGIYWMVSGENLRDTTTRDVKVSNPEFSYTATKVGDVTVTCYIFCKGYTNSSVSVSYAAIDPETSLSGLEGETTLIDGNKFYVAPIGGVTWMANNLYGTQSGISFHLASVTDSFLGRFYTWEEALTACPKGWKLPTAREWDALGSDAGVLMADATVLQKQMWAYWPGISITNATKFNAIPAGYVDRSGGDDNVQGFMDYAIFWTADEADEDPSLAQYRYIYSQHPEVKKGSGSKTSLALSVRCIKE